MQDEESDNLSNEAFRSSILALSAWESLSGGGVLPVVVVGQFKRRRGGSGGGESAGLSCQE